MFSQQPVANFADPNVILKELQSWWEIPAIAQYVSLFRESFNLPEIEIEELEKGLTEDSISNPSRWLEEFILALLRSYMANRVNAENWEVQLQKLVNRKWPANKEKPFPEEKTFVELGLRIKVEIIYALCLYRLDRNDIAEIMKSMDADALRVQKLGIDDLGNTYWYFYGTRLYMEEKCKGETSWHEEWQKQKNTIFKKRGRGRPRKHRRIMLSDGESEDFEDMDSKNNGYMNVDPKSRWSVVCDTIEEWVNFAEKFKNSKSKSEKALFQIVQENFLPTLNKIYEEKEKKLQQKLKELMPVREKIITRRETKKLRGETFDSPVNGYSSCSDEFYKMHMVKDRAKRLEERRKRASEVFNEVQQCKRRRLSESPKHLDVEYDIPDENDYNYALIPKNIGQKMDLQVQMERLLSAVRLHKDAWPFLYPVSEEDAPGYHDIIKDPIDLSTIDNRLQNGVYETVGELDEDFSRMVNNCKLYNGEQHAYSQMVQTLWKMFRKGVSKILDTISLEENIIVAFDENSNSSNNSDLLKSPHIQTSKKLLHRKKKKKKFEMKALEMLAQASEVAVQNVNGSHMLNKSHMYDEQKDFSNLKISTTNSHPPSLIEKFSSESSNESSGDNNPNCGNYSTFLNQTINAPEHSTQTSSNEIMTAENELTSNNLDNLTNFIEKNNVKGLNILSNNDVRNVLSDGSSNHHDNSNNLTGGFVKESGNSDNLDHGLDILDNDNVSNIISQIIKHPVYNSDNQMLIQNKGNSTLCSVGHSPKQDVNLNKNRRNSPPKTLANVVSHPSTESLSIIQNVINTQADLGNQSTTLTTVDASAIGIAPYNIQAKKPLGVDLNKSHNQLNKENLQNALTSLGHENGISPKLFCPQQQPSNQLLTNQYSEVMNSSQTDITYQSFDLPTSTSTAQDIYTSGSPLQVPTTYPMQQQMLTQSNLMRMTIPQNAAQLVMVSDANTGPGITYHLYTTQSKVNGGENYLGYIPSSAASTIRMSPILNNTASVSQDNFHENSPSQKKSSLPQQTQTFTQQVPSKSITCSSVSSRNSTVPKTLPITSSNFHPVKDKTTVIRKAFEINPSDNVATKSNAHQSYNSLDNSNSLFQKVTPKAIPLVFSSYNQSATNPTELRLKDNQSGGLTLQMSNTLPIVQQVLIPAGQQSIQLQNGGQLVYSNPPNSINKLLSNNQIAQISSVRQENQNFAKTQMVTQTPIMQIPRNIMQGLQLQNNAPAFTQISQNPQVVNIPAFMITNPSASSSPAVLEQYHPFASRRQLPMNGQGNG